MKASIVYCHYVDGKDTLIEFKKGIDDLFSASDILKENHDLWLKLTLGKNLDYNSKLKIRDHLSHLPLNVGIILDPTDRGAAVSYYQIMANPKFYHPSDIIVNASLQQYPIGSQDSLESILWLASKLKKNNILYGVGARDGPINLCFHEKNNDLRKIHELVHSISMSYKPPKARENTEEAYAAFGESTSGLYLLNVNHREYGKLISHLNKNNFSGFSPDYFVALFSGMVDSVESEPVVNRLNSTKEVSENCEKENVMTLIRQSTKELGTTIVRERLISVLNEKTSEKLKEYFDHDSVRDVLRVMMESLVF
jgi:hypothetical protein